MTSFAPCLPPRNSAEFAMSADDGRNSLCRVRPGDAARVHELEGPSGDPTFQERISQFLQSQLGRPWQQVWRQLREEFAVSAVTLARLRIHVQQCVACDVLLQGGELRHASGLWRGQRLTGGWRQPLYVCPISGLLRPIALPAGRAPVCVEAQKLG